MHLCEQQPDKLDLFLGFFSLFFPLTQCDFCIEFGIYYNRLDDTWPQQKKDLDLVLDETVNYFLVPALGLQYVPIAYLYLYMI